MELQALVVVHDAGIREHEADWMAPFSIDCPLEQALVFAHIADLLPPPRVRAHIAQKVLLLIWRIAVGVGFPVAASASGEGIV